MRSFELKYRLGGEEFLIVLPGVTLQTGEMLAERLRAAVEQAQPTGVPVTISVGVSAATGEAVNYDPMFRAADRALRGQAWRTKQGGRIAARPGAARG